MRKGTIDIGKLSGLITRSSSSLDDLLCEVGRDNFASLSLCLFHNQKSTLSIVSYNLIVNLPDPKEFHLETILSDLGQTENSLNWKKEIDVSRKHRKGKGEEERERGKEAKGKLQSGKEKF